MTAVSSPESRRIRLISDGVVASYIHDISARPSPATNGRRAGRLAHTRAALRARDEHGRRPASGAPIGASRAPIGTSRAPIGASERG